MTKIGMDLVKQLRDRTGAGMMDCKKALEESNGDIEKALESLRKKGADIAAKRAGKGTSEGIIHAYIHPGSQLGVLVEVNCETDFVARTEAVANFAKDLCLQIAAFDPAYLSPEDVDSAFLDKERKFHTEQMKESGKPENVIEKIVDGKIQKLYTEVCLMNQQFVKNDKITVADALKELIAKTGENIKVKRFAKFEIGTN